jgi:hypothetical protein
LKPYIVIPGVIVLIIGIGLFSVSYLAPATQTITTTHVVIPDATRKIDAGGTWSFGTNLTKGEVLNGALSIANYNASAGPIFFYIQNESSYVSWGGCAPCAGNNLENYTLPSSGSYSFSWTAPYSGPFYLTFDDEAYPQSAQAAFNANGTVTTTNSIPNTSFGYPGVALSVIGVALAAVGSVVGGRKSSPPKPSA